MELLALGVHSAWHAVPNARSVTSKVHKLVQCVALLHGVCMHVCMYVCENK